MDEEDTDTNIAEQLMDSAEQSPDVAQQTVDLVTYLTDLGYGYLEALLRPWVAYQVAIVLVVLTVAWLIHRWTAPAVRKWVNTREGWPKWRVLTILEVQRRVQMLVFLVLLWSIVWVMREVAWPSRSYLMAIVANLATAWLIVSVGTRLIANPILRSVVRYGAWIWVTLSILNLDDETQVFLDNLALNLGDVRVSLWALLQAAVLIGMFLVIARLLSTVTKARIETNEELSPSVRVLTVKLVQLLFYSAAIFMGLKAVGVDLTGLAVLSGAIGLGLGFGLQKVVSNLVSGLIILLDKSIKPGDVISLGDTFGWIQSLGARYVSVVTRDGREYLIPNEDLITGQVVNWSHSNDFVRLDIYFGTAYHDDPHQVRKVAVEAASRVERVLDSRKPVCHIVGFGDSSVDYILRFWIRDPTGGLTNIRGNVYLSLWDAFQESGISMPFPQREVTLLNRDRSEPISDESNL